ncbi:MAG: FHA domain-containing protein [Planctomycetota bacterium]
MNVKLVVASGKSAGKSIAVKGNKLLIGRAEECDVRPLSEEVSRRHCAIHIGPSGVTVEDLKSRNGTFLNGEKISTATKVADGDIIRVGALELKASIMMPVSTGSIEDVSEWLSEDENSSESRDTTSVFRAPTSDTDSSNIHSNASPVRAGESATAIPGDSGTVGLSNDSSASGIFRLRQALESKAAPGVLPKSEKKEAGTSREAAAQALKKFFDNR